MPENSPAAAANSSAIAAAANSSAIAAAANNASAGNGANAAGNAASSGGEDYAASEEEPAASAHELTTTTLTPLSVRRGVGKAANKAGSSFVPRRRAMGNVPAVTAAVVPTNDTNVGSANATAEMSVVGGTSADVTAMPANENAGLLSASDTPAAPTNEIAAVMPANEITEVTTSIGSAAILPTNEAIGTVARVNIAANGKRGAGRWGKGKNGPAFSAGKGKNGAAVAARKGKNGAAVAAGKGKTRMGIFKMAPSLLASLDRRVVASALDKFSRIDQDHLQ